MDVLILVNGIRRMVVEREREKENKKQIQIKNFERHPIYSRVPTHVWHDVWQI